jgi:phospholipid/cholesterol/gamma-HCH transport system substrate-binding protein
VLGVPVGTVTRVEPTGTDVTVTMTYDDEVKLPADARAVIIAPSVVGDRYVQLTPAYPGTGEVLTDGAELSVEDTAEPLELDQIYESLDRLNVALGPRGANKSGALSDLLSVTADNFGGQGTTFRQTIKDYSRLSATLAGNSDELFGSVEALGSFMETLAENDQTVRQFNQSLADVSTMLSGEREELVAATKNLSVALTAVKEFVEENKGSLSRNITGINRVAKVLVRQRAALDEILHVAPGALNNLALTYNPQAGTLDTRANFGESINQLEIDPAAFLCGFVGQVERSGQVCDRITDLLARPRAGALGRTPAPLPAQDVFDPTLGGLVAADPEVQR